MSPTHAHGPQRPLNLEDIALKAGVSRSTVSRVINDEPYVSAATRARVQAVIDKEGFVPNLAARMLVTQRTHVLGIVIPHSLLTTFQDAYYYPTLLSGVSEMTLDRGFASLLWWGQSPQEEERFYQRILQQNQLVDGLIIASATADDPLITRLVQIGTHFVMVERPSRANPRVSYVSIDNVGAARMAVAHLISSGRRRVGTITGALDNVDGIDRLTGYRQALDDADLLRDSALVAQGWFTRESGYIGARSLIAAKVDAIFAANDVTALGALDALKDAGLRVPDDVAVVGFDDLPTAVQAVPALTSVRQPIHQKGALATSLLIDLIEGAVQEPRQILLPTQLIVRQSSGG